MRGWDPRTRRSPGSPWTRRNRHAAGGGVLAVGAVALVLVLLLPSAAATFHIVVSPPYVGGYPIIDTAANSVGCHASARFLNPPSASISSGRVKWDVRTNASTCSGAPYPQYSITAADAGFSGINFTVPVSGTYTVTFDWRLSIGVSLSCGGNASNYARASLYAWGVLYVPSNQSYLAVDADFVVFNQISTGSFEHQTQNLTEVLKGKAPLVEGVVYQFETLLEGGTTSWLVGPGNSVAQLNLAVQGDGAQLRSLSVSS